MNSESEEYIIKKARELGFDDAAFAAADEPEWARSCLVMFKRYRAAQPGQDPGYAAVSGYYPASHTGWQAEGAMEKWLTNIGIRAERNRSYPVKELARRTGGSFGKNSLYYHDTLGSMVFIASIFTDFEAECSGAGGDYRLCTACDGCDICRNVCPTGAIEEGDMELCLRKQINTYPISEIGQKHIYQLFGCEKCQTCCPINADVFERGVSFRVSEILSGEANEALRTLVGRNVARSRRIAAQALALAKNQNKIVD